jgi:hypothetical protein
MQVKLGIVLISISFAAFQARLHSSQFPLHFTHHLEQQLDLRKCNGADCTCSSNEISSVKNINLQSATRILYCIHQLQNFQWHIQNVIGKEAFDKLATVFKCFETPGKKATWLTDATSECIDAMPEQLFQFDHGSWDCIILFICIAIIRENCKTAIIICIFVRHQ